MLFIQYKYDAMRYLLILLTTLLSISVAYGQPVKNTPEVTWISPKTVQSNTTADKLSVEVCVKSSTKLKDVKLYLNDKEVKPKTLDTVPDVVSVRPNSCNKLVKEVLVLSKGANYLKLVATNEAGATTQTYTVRYSQPRISVVDAPKPERRKALVIGNARYASQAYIPNCYNDADSIEHIFKKLNFTVVKKMDLSMQSFLQTLDSFCVDIDQYDAVVVYYSGHGFEVNGFNCMFPVDATVADLPNLLGQYSITSDPSNPIMQRFFANGVKKTIFILDACRDNPLSDALKDDGYGKHLKSAHFDKKTFLIDSSDRTRMRIEKDNGVSAPAGCLIAYATVAGMKAESVSRNSGRNSPYTAALLKNLKRQGLPVIDMLKEVQRTLKNTRLLEQDCSFYYSLPEDFTFNMIDTSLYASRNGVLMNYTDERDKKYCGVYRSISIDTEAMEDTVSGLQFHLDFEVNGMRGDGRVYIEFYDEQGLPLKDFNQAWTDGNIRLRSEFSTNNYSYSNSDLSRDLFLSYASFDPALKGQTVHYVITASANDYIKLKTKLRPLVLPVWK
ncbi:caspase family protein [Chitinophaga horti]|uniref:Caspase family protein n=1 Tax=Chitinophaga horti TaxID=2920382 RepID=A0ABY6J5M2_9BACT|nr:caspase family protein [Chitinophaga horti]UYQ94985.1 caspase family protein [Chitinophaga horti]